MMTSEPSLSGKAHHHTRIGSVPWAARNAMLAMSDSGRPIVKCHLLCYTSHSFSRMAIPSSDYLRLHYTDYLHLHFHRVEIPSNFPILTKRQKTGHLLADLLI